MSTATERSFLYTVDARALVLLVLVMLFAVLPSGLSWSETPPDGMLEGSLVNRIQWFSLYGLALWILWRQGASAWEPQVLMNPMLFAMALYCAFSIAWSALPEVTLKRSVQLGGLILICVAVSSSLKASITQVIAILSLTLTGLVVASVLMVLLNPALGKETMDAFELRDAWRGVLDQKNTLGAVSFINLFLWAVLWSTQPPPLKVALPGIGLTILCLLMSRSSTSISLTVLAIAAFVLLRGQPIRSPMWLQRTAVVLLFLGGVLLQVFFIVESRLPDWTELVEPFAQLFGKSADLSGRTDIWKFMWPEIDKHPVFGIGYGAFWMGIGSPSQVILDNLYWVPYQAHNGYLDMLNELGVTGVALFVGVLLFHARNIHALLRTDRPAAAFHASLLVVYLVSNITESSAFRGVNFMHLLVVMSLCLANQQAWNARRVVPSVHQGAARIPQRGQPEHRSSGT